MRIVSFCMAFDSLLCLDLRPTILQYFGAALCDRIDLVMAKGERKHLSILSSLSWRTGPYFHDLFKFLSA